MPRRIRRHRRRSDAALRHRQRRRWIASNRLGGNGVGVRSPRRCRVGCCRRRRRSFRHRWRGTFLSGLRMILTARNGTRSEDESLRSLCHDRCSIFTIEERRENSTWLLRRWCLRRRCRRRLRLRCRGARWNCWRAGCITGRSGFATDLWRGGRRRGTRHTQ